MTIKRNYFTIIELLVVISIIAILASILLPALSKARNNAKVIFCLNKQKELSSCCQFYANDYDGFILSFYYNKKYYCTHLLENGYVKSEGLFNCSEYSGYSSTTWGRTVYGINVFLGHNRKSGLEKLSKIKNPSQILNLGEAVLGKKWRDEGIVEARSRVDGSYLSDDSGNAGILYPLHKRYCNVNFVDGHCKTVRAGSGSNCKNVYSSGGGEINEKFTPNSNFLFWGWTEWNSNQ